MKILSISDVITNSSSEVFCIYNKYAFERLKGLVNCILDTFDTGKNFDDVFEIKYYLTDWAEDEGMTVEEALNYDEAGCPPPMEGYEIVVKDKSLPYNALADALTNLDTIFEADIYYD